MIITLERIFNDLAILFFGLIFFILGMFLSIYTAPFPIIGTISVLFVIISLLLFYILLLEFSIFYLTKIFGILTSYYQNYKKWWFFFGVIIIVIILYGSMDRIAPQNTIIRSYITPTIVIIVAFLVQILKPIYEPKIIEFYNNHFK